MTEYVPTDEKVGPRFPLLLTTGRILSQYNVGAQTRRTDNVVWHGEDLLVRTDYGLFADQLTGYQTRANRQAFEEAIDGQPARVVTFDQPDGSRFTAVHFSDLGRLGAGPKKLTLVVISSGSRTTEEALRIVRSIRFRR